MTKKNKLSSQKRLAIAGFFAIFTALLFMISSVPATAGTGNHQPATSQTTTVNYIPNPQLQTNITWSTFHSNWKPLEYTNGTANETLNAQVNSNYKEPFTINPTDIQAPGVLQNENLSGAGIWSNLKTWSYTNTATSTTSTSTIGKENDITLEATGNATLGKTFSSAIKVPISDYPSSNPSYDYVTAIYSLSGTSVTGVSACINVFNYSAQTGAKTGTLKGSQVKPGENIFFSEPLTDFKGATFNTTPGEKGYSQHLGIQITINTPSGTTDTWTATLTGLALTEYQMNIGTNATGQAITETTNSHMKSFSPSFAYTSITNGGYTVSISQSMQNETISQTSINNGVYTEEATYQGILTLPSAPDLSYSNSIISMKINLTGKQYLVANLNGISYLAEIQKINNGTFTFSTVNPNSQNSIVIQAEYTTAQWTASSGAPSIWSIAGIEYYWYILLGAGLGLIGLGTGISKHANSLRVGKR